MRLRYFFTSWKLWPTAFRRGFILITFTWPLELPSHWRKWLDMHIKEQVNLQAWWNWEERKNNCEKRGRRTLKKSFEIISAECRKTNITFFTNFLVKFNVQVSKTTMSAIMDMEACVNYRYSWLIIRNWDGEVEHHNDLQWKFRK